MNSKIIVASCIFIIAILLTLISMKNVDNLNSGSLINRSTLANSNITKLSLEVVKLHNKSSDCWTIISENVYDISSYINVHPGGPIIAEACGKDGTQLFATKGGGGRDHSDFAKNLLKSFLLGPINSNISNNVNNNAKVSNNNITINNQTTNTTITNYTVLTMAELAKHSTSSSCWLLINNKIYDSTNYINVHPGGPTRILNYCGKDATTVFENRGGSGTHSTNARNILASFYVGDLNANVPTTQINTTIPYNQSGGGEWEDDDDD